MGARGLSRHNDGEGFDVTVALAHGQECRGSRMSGGNGRLKGSDASVVEVEAPGSGGHRSWIATTPERSFTN